MKKKFLALDNHQGKEGLSFSPNIVHSIQINIHHWIIQQLYKNSNVFPTPYTSTPVTMPIQSAVSLNPQLLS